MGDSDLDPFYNGWDDVGDFHEKFGLDSVTWHGSRPRDVPADVIEFRLNFLLEELTEIVQAVGGHFTYTDGEGNHKLGISVPGDNKINHAGFFDGLIDLVYVAYGTGHFMGYPWVKGWRLVQKANMAKERAKADASNSLRGHVLDVVKPDGWTAPDIGGLLKRFGWRTQ